MREPTRVLVLEGVEGAGKSELAGLLKERGWGSVHFKHETHSDRLVEWLYGIARAAEESEDGRVVVDRLHVSARVYGQLVRGVPDINDFDAWVVDGWLQARGGEVCYLQSRDNSVTQERLQEKFQGMVKKTDVEVSYEEELRSRGVRAYYHSPEDWSSEQLAVHYNGWLKALEPVNDEGMGTRRPRVWLVGFQHNLKPIAWEHRRYHTSFSGGCGTHLYRTLRVAQLDYSQVHVSNAYDDDGNLRDLEEKWEALGEPPIVAMGNDASAALNEFQLPHNQIAHPSYAKRFRRYDVVGYARELREAAGI